MDVTRSQVRRRLASAALLILSMGAGAVQAGGAPSILVTVADSGNVPRHDWPISVSVPFPASTLREVSEIGVADAGGSPLPVQAHPLVRWPDGSIRWVRIDTRLNLAPGRKSRLQVMLGKAGRQAQAKGNHSFGRHLQVSEGQEMIEVNTGALSFKVPKTRFAILEQVRTGEHQLRGAITSFVVADGKRLDARRPRQVRVVENGVLRVALELEGEYGEGIDYAVRLEAYARKPLVRVLHTFVNRKPVPYVHLSRLALEWPLQLQPEVGYRVGVEGNRVRTGKLSPEGVRLYQPDNSTYRVGDSEEAGRLSGWWALQARNLNLGMAVRWFWQEYPQAATLSPDRLTYDMWAPESSPARVGMGAAKSHEFLIWVSPGDPPGWVNEGAGAYWVPVANVDPTWIVATKALPGAIAAGSAAKEFLHKTSRGMVEYLDRNATEVWDDGGGVHCRDQQPGRQRIGAYGMWNWGDWNFPHYRDNTKGCDAWGNMEYDTPQVLALLYAGTGDPRAYDAMLAAARHFTDVDIIHFSDTHPEWVGMNHPKNPLHFTFELGGVDLGHTWTEGLLSTYYLTGDDRFLRAARGIADYLVRRIDSLILAGNPRQWGWPQIALLAVYDATGDETYRRAAHEFARRGMRAFQPKRVDDWKVGVLADALAYTHAATQDEEIRNWLYEYAGAVADARREDARFYPAVAYVAALKHDSALRRLVMKRVERLQPTGWGKPFTLDGRIGFRIHSLLATEEANATDAHRPRSLR